MEAFVNILREDYPAFTYVTSEQASWSAKSQQISYSPQFSDSSLWALLHELGHALCGHHSYKSDLGLLRMETEAWHKAVELSNRYNITIDNEHIQDCLDSYRDWLHKRSTCPTCGSHGLQPAQGLYNCLNCQNTWQVTTSRFCRPYRFKKALMTNK
jgi:hypothetical protein